MKKTLFAACVMLGLSQLWASATPDAARDTTDEVNEVAGRPHKEQYTHFRTLREQEAETLIGLPCARSDCNNDTGRAHDLLSHRLDPREDEGTAFVCGGVASGPYCCASVAYHADLLRIQRLSPQVRERLDLLAKANVPHAQRHVILPKIESMLTPLLNPFSGWQNEPRKVTREHVFCRGVYAYFAQALVREVVDHPHIEALSFVSCGTQPLILPVLEALARKGSGPAALSFGARHLCHCHEGVYPALNNALRDMSFLNQITFEDAHHDSWHRYVGQFMAALLESTSVKRLSLKGKPQSCCVPLVMGQEAFSSRGLDWARGCYHTVILSKEDFVLFQKSSLEALEVYNPSAGNYFMASPDFGVFLKETTSLRTLTLRGQGKDYSNPENDRKAFVASVLGSTSLTSVIFDGSLAHRSFGLTDTDREAIEAHLEKNRQALEVGASASSS